MPNKISLYQKIREPEKNILQLMALAHEPLAKTTIISCLRRLGIKTRNGILFNQNSINQTLDSLSAMELVHTQNEIILCPELSFFCVKEAMTNGTFLPISEQILQEIPVRAPWGEGYQFKRYPRFLRHLRFSLFKGDPWSFLNQLFHQAYREFPDQTYREHPLVTLFNSPFDAEYLRLFPTTIHHSVLGYLLYVAKMKITSAAPVVDFILEEIPKNKDNSVSYHALLAHYLSFWGRWQEAREHFTAIPNTSSDQPIGLCGWHQTLAGNDHAAIDLFAKDYAVILKLSGKKKIFFEDISGAFFIVSLIRTGDAKHLAKASQYLNLIDSIKGHPLQAYSPSLRKGLSLIQGLQSKTANKTYPQSTDHGISPASILFILLADFWEDQSTCRKKHTETLTDLKNRAQTAGQFWLASEAAELLARLGIDEEKNRSLANSIRQKYHLVSIIDAVPVVDPWERSLKALINLTSNAKERANVSSEGTKASQRLIWKFSYSDKSGLCDITPRLQVLNKSGNWSAGRAVALKNLAKEAANMVGLSEQDRNICATIKIGYESTYYSYYKHEIYAFQLESALHALVGHPLIFLENSSDTKIDLVAGEPELLVTRKKGRIEVRMHPEPLPEIKYRVVKETPTRYKLVRFSPQHQAIANIVQRGLKAPDQAEQLTTQAIAALSSLITIHSDLEGGTANSREVEADPRPHIHLLPYLDGLKAEILVRPLSEADTWYRPGIGGQKVFAELAGEKLHSSRSLQTEKELAANIIKACPTLRQQEENEGEFLLPSPEESLEFLLELQELGDQTIVEWPQGQSLRLRGRAQASSLSIQFKQERDWFKASGSLSVDETGVIALQKLLGLLDQAKGRFVRLDDGSFLALSREFRNRLDELRAFGEPHGDGVRFSPLAAFGLEDLCHEAGEFSGDKHWKKHLKRMSEIIDPELPSTLQAELRDYQITGFKWLSQLAHWGIGACLADDMGLGKTIQALAALLRLAPDGPTLVVAPLSVLMNWQDEAQRFAPTLNVIMFGPGDRQQTLLGLQPFDLLICSYGLLQIESEKLSQVKWQTIVLDEAQAIKNMNTKRAKAATSLNAQFKIITTGTPVENHLGELWSLFDFITPGLLVSFQHFNRAFMSTVCPEADKQARARLKKLIQPFILRRVKSQVLQELPARTEITMRVQMSSEEAALYEAQRRSAVEKLSSVDSEPQGQQQIRIFAEIMRLRRLCCNPSLVLPNCTIESAKLKVFGELLDDILDNHHKALIFSQFVDHLQILVKYLDKRGITHQYLDGSTPVATRKKRINEFQAGKGDVFLISLKADGSTPVATRKKRINEFQAGKGDVFLISLKAGGSGLNLTAADYVIHMDPWWNPAVEDQASDRAHRIGQKRPVTIYRLVMGDSIEEQIIKLHREKRDLADSLLAGGDMSGKMSAAELLGLLKESGM